MAMQFSTTGRNAMLDAFETHVGTAPTARLRTGARRPIAPPPARARFSPR